MEVLNKLGIRKVYKRSVKGERGVKDHYDNVTDLDDIDIKKLLRMRRRKDSKKF